jgi:hypothetical protein
MGEQGDEQACGSKICRLRLASICRFMLEIYRSAFNNAWETYADRGQAREGIAPQLRRQWHSPC